MRFLASGTTHEGQKRDHNEDAFLVDLANGVFVVADGMGGHKHGEVASDAVIQSFKTPSEKLDVQHSNPTLSEDANMLHVCIQQANTKINRMSGDDVDLGMQSRRMGTTVVALRIGQTKAAYAHVGDSRIYLMRDGELTPLTKDHSYHQEMLDAGFPEEKVNQLNIKNIITRAVGLNPDVEVVVGEINLRSGDKFLLCSDGLTNEINDQELARLMQIPAGPDQITNMMVWSANDQGGKDNITAIVVCIL